jgi:hypothetical protein
MTATSLGRPGPPARKNAGSGWLAAAARFQPGDAQADPAAIGLDPVLRHLQGGALRLHVGAGAFGGQRAGLEVDRAEAAGCIAGASAPAAVAAPGKHQAGQHPGQREVVSLHRARFPWRTFLSTTTGCRGRCDPTYTGSAPTAMGNDESAAGGAQTWQSRARPWPVQGGIGGGQQHPKGQCSGPTAMRV